MQFKARTIYVYEAFAENKETVSPEGPELNLLGNDEQGPRDGDLWRQDPALLALVIT